jgi:hypothetical protein
MEARHAAIALAIGRMGIGAVALAAPRRASRVMFGPAGSEGHTAAFARMLGGRDIALGLGVVVALGRGEQVRGWLEAGAFADGVDFAAALLAKDAMSRGGRTGTVLMAAAAAVTGIALSRQLSLAGRSTASSIAPKPTDLIS